MQLLHRKRNCGHFLHELGADLFRNSAAARAGEEHTSVMTVHARFSLDTLQKFQRLLWLLGLVPLVILPQDLICRRVNHDGFHRG